MGLGPRITICESPAHSIAPAHYMVPEPLPNPNPRHFEVLKVEQIGPHLIAEVRYPDCTNYEGTKILVFKNMTEIELRSLDSLDPHFCKGDHPSPFARFEPTEEGWNAAQTLASRIL